VSKGTVANVVADLKAGRILDVQEPAEQPGLLQELVLGLLEPLTNSKQVYTIQTLVDIGNSGLNTSNLKAPNMFAVYLRRKGVPLRLRIIFPS